MLKFAKNLLPAAFPWKFAGIALALVSVVGMIWLTVRAVNSYNTTLYNNGFRAGSDMMEKQWHSANSQALAKQRDQIVADAIQTNNAVKEYLADISNREPQILRVNERTTIYEKSPVGSEQCLDAVGVSLLEDNRKALGSNTPGS